MDTAALYQYYLDYPRISTDTRQAMDDTIFFALRGDSFDGNKFAIASLEKGAAYAVVSDGQLLLDNPNYAQRLLRVDDTLLSLQELARFHRHKLTIPILAITGSNGKTTTKELVNRVLSERFATYATRGNLNNHIGVPLTLLAMDSSVELGIVEMGASSCGEIALLSSIAAPNFGIINNVGRAHLGGFGGEAGVRRGKGELFDYLASNDGVAFVAEDDPTLCTMASERGGLATIRYSYSLAVGCRHHLVGDYNLKNIAAAVAIGRYFDIDDESIDRAIESYHPENSRSQRVETSCNTIIVDCYNANPSSMELAVANLLGETLRQRESKLMILGDMLELGEWSLIEHQRLIEQAESVSDGDVWLVGPNFIEAHSLMSCSSRVRCFGSSDAVVDHIRHTPLSGRLILLKGSRGVRLERIIPLL